jgi:tungstate transport system ATP-binding protein
VTAPILEGLDLSIRYAGRTILEVPHITVQPGEVLALIGPNGAGKSTLLRVLGLLEPPTSGTVRFHGRPVRWDSRDLLAIRRRLASVFQEALLCDTSVEANVRLGFRLRGLSSKEAATQVQAWLTRLGIAHLARRQARTLSGGEAQRTSLARAFAIQPDVLLLDEPFAALDPLTRDELLTVLQSLLHRGGVTTVFVTHDRDEALRLGDRIAVMMDGRIPQVGRPSEVFGRPVSEEVARFVGVETILPGRVTGERSGLLTVEVDGTKIEALGRVSVGESVLVCLRPEDLVMRRRDERMTPDSARNRLEGRVQEAIPLGAQYRVRIASDPALGGVVALVTKQSFHELGLEPGSQVTVTFKASAVHLIRR